MGQNFAPPTRLAHYSNVRKINAGEDPRVARGAQGSGSNRSVLDWVNERSGRWLEADF